MVKVTLKDRNRYLLLIIDKIYDRGIMIIIISIRSAWVGGRIALRGF